MSVYIVIFILMQIRDEIDAVYIMCIHLFRINSIRHTVCMFNFECLLFDCLCDETIHITKKAQKFSGNKEEEVVHIVIQFENQMSLIYL